MHDEAIEKVLEMNKQLMDTIYKACETSAKAFKTDTVPLSLIKEVHEMAYKNLEKAMRNGLSSKS